MAAQPDPGYEHPRTLDPDRSGGVELVAIRHEAGRVSAQNEVTIMHDKPRTHISTLNMTTIYLKLG